MDGITVLSEIVRNPPIYNQLRVFFILIALVCVCAIITVCTKEKRRKWYDFIIGIVCGGLALVCLFGIFNSLRPNETLQRIITSDEVRLNEFYENYEIIEREGATFLVRERIPEEKLEKEYLEE